MLSIGKLTDGADSARYYEESVASGREDYYSGKGESRGEWIGGGAVALGLDGTVAKGQLEALLVHAVHPSTRVPLRETTCTVQGFDLTFSAPKSVSVVFAIGGPPIREAVVGAHEAAVRDALGYLEREAVQVRRGKAGVIKEHAGGLVAAAYRHRTSRAGDPQLHTHVVAANFAQGADGRWTALHGAPLFTHAKTAGYLYQAALRTRLSRELGVDWTPVHHGAADIAGIPTAVLEHFSERGFEIRDVMARRGTRSANAARVAALVTRRAKDYAVKESTLYERWQARAGEHGLTRDHLMSLLGRPAPEPSREELHGVAALLAGESGLTAQASTFTRREVLQAWAEAHRLGSDVATLELLADRWLASDLAVRVDGEPRQAGQDETAAGRRGTRVAAVENRFSTPTMLATERQLLDSAAARTATGVAVAAPELVEAALARRGYLSDEQRAMAVALTSSGDGVQVVRAKAGAGKTTALDAARDAWQAAGVAVQGTALGSFATQELRDAGIDACTIAGLLFDVQRHGGGLQPGSVLIVDEAGMVGTRTLALLADQAARARAKLVLVGDDRQLPEIDAGGAFRGLATRLGAIELHDNRRQRDAEDRQVLDAQREGRPSELIESLRRRGRLAVAPTVEETRHTLVRDWCAGAQADGLPNVAMIALRRSEVRELNELAREQMRAEGRLGDVELVVGGRAFAVGDRIVTRQNSRRLGVVNGSQGEIATIHADGSLVMRLDRGAEVLLSPEYVAGRRQGQAFVDHGYAVTAHGLQGGTVERSYVLGSEDLYREWGYVAFSRHRDELRFYITAPDPPQPDQRALGDADDPLNAIVRALGESRAKGLAADVASQGEIRAIPDARLASEAEHLRAVVDTAPAVAAHALEHLDAEHALVAAELRRAEASQPPPAQLTATHDTHAQAPPLAVTRWREQAATLEAQRSEVLARAGNPDAWIAGHQLEVRRLVAIEAELAGRRELQHVEALRTVTIAPPNYVTDALGARPDEPSRRRAWDRGARAIESYRQRHGRDLAPEIAGLGGTPADPSGRTAYFTATRRLDEARSDLHRGLEPGAISRRLPPSER